MGLQITSKMLSKPHSLTSSVENFHIKSKAVAKSHRSYVLRLCNPMLVCAKNHMYDVMFWLEFCLPRHAVENNILNARRSQFEEGYMTNS